METPNDNARSEEDVAVEHAADRLADRFPEVDRDRIDELVEQRHHDFDGAPVRDFVPVLVEHDVKRELREDT
ncbi:hypothetical protein [Leifsonia sp. NPDC080035]|uniref:Uncharacterized protein n=1 Tax=Leifsonia sp. NPDC080035 TaxID=3143936 RepID=A0AAU7G7A6_9MICO